VNERTRLLRRQRLRIKSNQRERGSTRKGGLTIISVPSLGRISRSWDGGHEYFSLQWRAPHGTGLRPMTASHVLSRSSRKAPDWASSRRCTGPTAGADDPQRVVLANDGHQVDPSVAKPSRGRPAVLEQLQLLRLRGLKTHFFGASAIEAPVYSGSTCSRSFLR
jgi:hypothetical protein